MENRIIEITNLEKSYGNVKAVDNISFFVNEGSFFSFLGPNGAGKSTTINMICTMISQDKGTIIIDGLKVGKDDKKIKEKIGIVFQDSILDSSLTVYENLKIRASFYKLKKSDAKEKIKRACEITDITNLLKRKYGKLSGGQRRRVDIARALINIPKILILDEPTTGLDPKTRVSMWEMIKKLQKQENTTIFLTTHYMEEASMSDYIYIINKGKIALHGTPHSLRQKYTKDTLKIIGDKLPIEKYLIDNNLEYVFKNNIFLVNIENTLQSISIVENLKEYLTNFEVINGTMDDVFLNCINESVGD